MSEPNYIRRTAQRDIAIRAKELASNIEKLVDDRFGVLNARWDGNESKCLDWIGEPIECQDDRIATLCEALATLMRGGK